jgi:hypothetical protein
MWILWINLSTNRLALTGIENFAVNSRTQTLVDAWGIEEYIPTTFADMAYIHTAKYLRGDHVLPVWLGYTLSFPSMDAQTEHMAYIRRCLHSCDSHDFSCAGD